MVFTHGMDYWLVEEKHFFRSDWLYAFNFCPFNQKIRLIAELLEKK